MVRWIAPRAENRLTVLAARSVAVNDSTRCAPEKKRLALYRELQAKQDGLSLTLRETFERLGTS
jgi:xylulokinase